MAIPAVHTLTTSLLSIIHPAMHPSESCYYHSQSIHQCILTNIHPYIQTMTIQKPISSAHHHTITIHNPFLLHTITIKNPFIHTSNKHFPSTIHSSMHHKCIITPLASQIHGWMDCASITHYHPQSIHLCIHQKHHSESICPCIHHIITIHKDYSYRHAVTQTMSDNWKMFHLQTYFIYSLLNLFIFHPIHVFSNGLFMFLFWAVIAVVVIFFSRNKQGGHCIICTSNEHER